ncbi:hypothetical protein [Sorangium sp. So ce1151]
MAHPVRRTAAAHEEAPVDHRLDVAIAGAGPVGLFLARELGLV